jgi:hypothetical protein
MAFVFQESDSGSSMGCSFTALGVDYSSLGHGSHFEREAGGERRSISVHCSVSYFVHCYMMYFLQCHEQKVSKPFKKCWIRVCK